MNASDDERYTLTGTSAFNVTGTCVLCGFVTARGYASGAKAAIHQHLATHHPARTPVTLPDDDGLGFVLVAPCPAGHEYWALPGGADPTVGNRLGLFDIWWEAHRCHVREGKHRA